MSLIRTTDLEQALSVARDLDRNKKDLIYKIPEVRSFHPEEFTIELDGATYKLDDVGLKHFLSKIKVPYNYFKLCTPELREKEVREGLALNASNNVDYKFKVKDDTIYGIVSRQYPSLNFETMVSKIRQNLPSAASLTEFDLSLHKADLRFLDDSQHYIDADMLNGMVDVSFSEIGDPFLIETGIFRKICTNGAKIKFSMAPSFKMPMVRFKEEVFQTAMMAIPGNMFAAVRPFAETFESLKSIELPGLGLTPEDLPAELQTVLKLALPNPAFQRDYKLVILQHYEADKNYSVNGMVNAVTRTARDINDVRVRQGFETSAGTFLANIVKARAQQHEPTTFTMDLPSLERVFKKKTV